MEIWTAAELYKARVERIAQAIWEAQREKVKTSISKNRKWSDNSVPQIFWEGYRNDAKAAIRALGLESDGINITSESKD